MTEAHSNKHCPIEELAPAIDGKIDRKDTKRTSRRLHLMRKVLRNPKSILSAVGLGLVTSIAACSPTTPQPTPTSIVATSTPVAATQHQQVAPSALAWEYAEHGRQRLTQLAEAKEGNGYQMLTGLKGIPGGLRDMAAKAETQGVEAISAVLGDTEGKKDSPFRADYETVLRAGTNRHLGAPLKVAEQGPVTIPDSEAFVKATSSLWLLPALEVGNPNVEDQLQNFRTYLHIARAISLDAASIEHYEQGTTLLGKTLESLTKVVRSGKLSATEQRGVIAGLQELLSSELELQNVLDTEYFVAVRRVESQKLDGEVQAKELEALAARFLAARPLFADPKAAELGFATKTESTTGKVANEWAEKGDFLPALARSRLAFTQLSAVKILAALEAYKKEKKTYPDKVEDLMPAYLSRIPTDWFSPEGRFVYTKSEKSFKLESVSPALPEAKNGRVSW